MSARFLIGDCRDVLKSLPDESVQCCVTSPPYWGLRDYGVGGAIGLETTLPEFIDELVGVFREIRRVLRIDGTCWINMGDSYSTGLFTRQGKPRNVPQEPNDWAGTELGDRGRAGHVTLVERTELGSLKQKDLVGQPWRLAFALQDEGWFLRSDIIWAKPNPMPESVTDRPTKSHEYVFLLTKSARYFYDAEAIREPAEYGRCDKTEWSRARNADPRDKRDAPPVTVRPIDASAGRNARSVWMIPTEPFPEAHFATFPTELARRCILAGSRPGDTVLDPFGGAGTVALVADRLQRDSISIELNPAYVEMAKRRLSNDAGMFTDLEVVA